ncbi:ATP-binding protein [Streptomyces minutiscleroticus]|uniref:ATP-binding protein n=1 Tax=Streptomyces minutiscleroticus TaxID=68238 RepID=A0A918P0C0_9ACTN|nr:ATP-binding protein [Streptomyces minutiscleroticus]GGY10072.1 ATP-binding protein [Streptomyces minutiscleroticus]
MDEAAPDDDRRVDESLVMLSAAYEGAAADVARARELARGFLARLQGVYGVPVSERVMDTVQLVVSELLTNACKYAPGPCLLDLELTAGQVDVTVWDSAAVLPLAKAADPGRVGQHGLEIVMAVSQGFAVHREPVGKRTTASVMLADDPGGDIAGRPPVPPPPIQG